MEKETGVLINQDACGRKRINDSHGDGRDAKDERVPNASGAPARDKNKPVRNTNKSRTRLLKPTPPTPRERTILFSFFLSRT